jgi:hypothetical protein
MMLEQMNRASAHRSQSGSAIGCRAQKSHRIIDDPCAENVQQSRIEHIDMVNSYMACLNHNDRLCFAMLYGKEMNLYPD